MGGAPALGPHPATHVAPADEDDGQRRTAGHGAARRGPSGHHRLSANGRICWPQPIGESQAGQALVTRSAAESTVPSMLPRAASMKETPRPAPARPVAPRVVDASCDVTAATPVKATPTRAIDAPATSDPAAGCPATHHAEPEQHGQHHVRGERDDHGRGQRGVAADHAGAQHLLATELLGLTGVPDDGEDAHHGGEHGQGQGVPVQGVAPDAGPGHQAEHPHAGVLDHDPGVRLQELGVLGVAVLEHGGRRGQEHGHAEDPCGQGDPVAPQREADQPHRAGEAAHRAAHHLGIRIARQARRCPRRSAAGTAPRAWAAR